MITGKTLIAWGYKPGPWFAAAIAAAEQARLAGADKQVIRAIIDCMAPRPIVVPRVQGALAYRLNIRAEDAAEAENVASVESHMRDLMRVPTIVAGSVMPDACPSGAAPGTHPRRRRGRGQGRHPSRHALGRHLLLDGAVSAGRRRPCRGAGRRHEA
jgi:tRNA-splicing ligase RtcB (3'-phosphate/5'-hydroxy nucleic acid ligase)